MRMTEDDRRAAGLSTVDINVPLPNHERMARDWSEPVIRNALPCDSIDELGRYPEFPILNMNDVVVLHEMGAYTLASATQFNGIAPPAVVTRDLPVRIQEYGSRS